MLLDNNIPMETRQSIIQEFELALKKAPVEKIALDEFKVRMGIFSDRMLATYHSNGKTWGANMEVEFNQEISELRSANENVFVGMPAFATKLSNPVIHTQEGGKINFSELKNGQGLTAVFDHATNKIDYKVSNEPSGMADRFGAPLELNNSRIVQRPGSQRGGHQSLASEMGGAFRDKVGFVIVKTGNTSIELHWNSISVNRNNYGHVEAPERFRQAIREAVLKEFVGFTITN